jgi:hypothetical protein
MSALLNAKFARIVLHAALRGSQHLGEGRAYLTHISSSIVTPLAVVLDQV